MKRRLRRVSVFRNHMTDALSVQAECIRWVQCPTLLSGLGGSIHVRFWHLATSLFRSLWGAKQTSSCHVARRSDLLPDLADSARIYMRLFGAARGAGTPPDIYEETKIAVAAHRDWLVTNQARERLKENWRRLKPRFGATHFGTALVLWDKSSG
jgi:hypothetical protein